jgi:plastocyanin
MTWLSRISFSAALAAYAVAATVSGEVRIVNSRDQNVRNKSDYSGVVVWLERVGAPQPESAPRTVKIVQKQKRFLPHLVAVPVGSTVDFPNLDLIFHNAFSNFAGQSFDVGLYPPGTSQKVRFAREGAVRVFCNIHPTMSAVIVVVRSPYIAISNKDGSFSIEGVEPGEYRMRAFHERSSDQTLQSLERRIAVQRSPMTLAPIVVSESGYIVSPHKNKYGKDYPPVIEDHAVYPAGRNP